MTNPTPERSKVQALEGLRGLMAWWVVLGHISLALGLKIPLIDKNILAVDVFIILSGFVISMLIDRKAETYGRYLARRAFRIFPLYLLVLVVSTVLIAVQLDAWTNIPFKTPENAVRAALATTAIESPLKHFAVHVPLLQGLVPVNWLSGVQWTLVGQAWSVSLEWQFYILAPLLFYLLRAPKRWIAALGLMVVLLVCGRFFTQAFIGGKIWHFGLGITSYLLFSTTSSRRAFIAFALVFCALIIAFGGAIQLVPIGIWAIVLLSSMAPAGKMRIVCETLGRPLFIKHGEISFSIYLIHMLPVTIAVAVLNRLQLGHDAYAVLLIAIVLPTTYILSRLSYRWIEKPFIALGAHLTLPRTEKSDPLSPQA